ncbi:MAG: glycerophosphodiester phosphodiesterase [Flavobacteriaceae bacterium]|nr:glycerophosphodiester phosphodiesterase [Flavobacteriaceae bacterium]
MNYSIDLQGHRGCRGIYPENTIPGFIHALELGVTTLEMDLVISKDHQVIVSHEPFFSHEISKDPQGKNISEENEKTHNIYQLTYDEIQQYDVGLRKHSRFPRQLKIEVSKPRFRDVVKASEKFANETGRDLPYYNVEIKRVPEQDSIFHPSAFDFAAQVASEVMKLGIVDRTTIQSFDPESLQMVKKFNSKIQLVLLVENNETPLQNIERLGFLPEIYSPDFHLVNEELILFCKENNIKLIPWTVNETADMERLLDLKVDGIITDYPNRLLKLTKEMGISVK